MHILEIRPNDKILIIAPHPDDECIGPGGILCLYPNQCSVLVISDGREGQEDLPSEECKGIRRAEFIDEMRFLGIRSYQMLDYKDGTLIQHIDCLRQIDLSVYTKIFVTGSHDNHPDHTAAYASVCQRLHQQQIHNVDVYLYEIHAPLENATHILDITNVIDKKKRLIQFHQSQLRTIPYDRYAECMAEYRALQNRLRGQYVEAYTLVLPEHGLDGSTMELEKQLQKSNLFYRILTRWVALKIKGRNIAEILEEISKNQALSYTDLAVYDTVFMENQRERLRLFMKDGSVTKVIFTSSSAVEGFCRLLGEYSYETVQAVCMGGKTEEAAKAAGMRTVTARNASIEELVLQC